MSRSNELKFLKDKLQHADQCDVPDLRRRINQLQEMVSAFRRGETRSPHSFEGRVRQ